MNALSIPIKGTQSKWKSRRTTCVRCRTTRRSTIDVKSTRKTTHDGSQCSWKHKWEVVDMVDTWYRLKDIWCRFSNRTSILSIATLAAVGMGNMPGDDLLLAYAEVNQSPQVLETSTIKISNEISEPGSIVKDCRTDEGDAKPVYWVTSRSVGQSPTLYPINQEGKLIVPPYSVQTRNVGTEEIVFVHRPSKGKMEDFIVLADTSNQFKNRDRLKFVEVTPELPDAATDDSNNHAIKPEREIFFEFPRGAADVSSTTSSSTFKVPIGPTNGIDLQYPQEDYDTSAIVVKDDTLWIFSKRRFGSSTALYRLPSETLSPSSVDDSSSDKSYTLEFIQEFSSGAPVAGADVSSDGKSLAVLTKETVFLFDLTTKASALNPLSKLIGRVPLKSTASPVGLTWDNAETMIVLFDNNELARISLGNI